MRHQETTLLRGAGRRSARALLAGWAILLGLSGCEDRETREQVDHELAVARAERDALARQLDKARSDLAVGRARNDMLGSQLRMAVAEADRRRSARERAADQADRLQKNLEWLQAKYDSLLLKNEVLEGGMADLNKITAALRRQIHELTQGPTTTAPSTRPDIKDLILPPGHASGGAAGNPPDGRRAP